MIAVCAAGYGGDGSTCSPCSIGKYKNTDANTACTNCATGKTTSSTGSTSSSVCIGEYNLISSYNLKQKLTY